MSYHGDGAVDQFRLPVAFAFGEPAERTLLAGELEAWAKARQALCGHTEQVPLCRVCRGTFAVNEAVSQGAGGARVFPER